MVKYRAMETTKIMMMISAVIPQHILRHLGTLEPFPMVFFTVGYLRIWEIVEKILVCKSFFTEESKMEIASSCSYKQRLLLLLFWHYN